ncbi:hypothetical protein [Fervidobacterium sp. 2310opik-2]|uniref:hypothetical protein n=1 Tax=Fervidobacterium sp. 2310opik-2 TaxID=1755815 RepID=UPI0013DFAA62|nr:hypothetical protein [Fervidobacterium sp. 2310opik-2]KAF2962556.1 hypothetical protein AS161_00630 [Fervidobacterium sp. 2310opik-2]
MNVELFRVLGVISAVLLFVQISLFVVRRIYKYLTKKPVFFDEINEDLGKGPHIYWSFIVSYRFYSWYVSAW